MSYSDSQIANVALTMLGSQRIAILSEDSEPARRVNAVYDILRDELLMEHPWTFAVERTSLAQLSDTPAFGYSYQYQLPSDCLKFLDRKNQSYDFRVEGSTVLCDSSTLYVRYIKRITDPGKFSPLFAQALSARIALRLAYSIANSSTLIERIKLLHDDIVARAKAADSQQAGTAKSLDDNTWLDARL